MVLQQKKAVLLLVTSALSRFALRFAADPPSINPESIVKSLLTKNPTHYDPFPDFKLSPCSACCVLSFV